MRNNSTILAVAATAAVFGWATSAEARKRVVDGGNVATCSVETAYGAIPTNGAVEVDIGIFDPSVFDPTRGGNCDSSTFSGFSVNIGGASYSSLFVNENGIVSFGAPIAAGPATPLFNLTSPAFAPFFADGFLPDLDALQFGYTDASVGLPNSFWLTWNAFLPQGSPTSAPNIFQLGLVDLGGGDFDLILNYESINWDSSAIGAQAGVTNGTGGYVLLPGAGIPGAYLGAYDAINDVCTGSLSTALACNAINDGSQVVGNPDPDTGQNAIGYYLFKFRNGVLISPPINQIPVPPAAGLFLLAGAAFGGWRLMRKS